MICNVEYICLFNMKYIVLQLPFLPPVLDSGPVPHPPLEVGLGVGLDKGVDRSNSAVVLWGVVYRGGGRGAIAWWGVTPHSQGRSSIFSIIKDEDSASICISNAG